MSKQSMNLTNQNHFDLTLDRPYKFRYFVLCTVHPNCSNRGPERGHVFNLENMPCVLILGTKIPISIGNYMLLSVIWE